MVNQYILWIFTQGKALLCWPNLIGFWSFVAADLEQQQQQRAQFGVANFLQRTRDNGETMVVRSSRDEEAALASLQPGAAAASSQQHEHEAVSVQKPVNFPPRKRSIPYGKN